MEFAHFVSYHIAGYTNPNFNANPNPNPNANPNPNSEPNPKLGKPFHKMCELYNTNQACHV